MLRIRTGSPAPAQDRASTSNGQAPTSSINDALDNLDQIKEMQQDTEFVKKQVQDINQKVTKNFDALDSLLAKAESAELSMQHQNKQMKKALGK